MIIFPTSQSNGATHNQSEFLWCHSLVTGPHPNTRIGQWEKAYYPNYFINHINLRLSPRDRWASVIQVIPPISSNLGKIKVSSLEHEVIHILQNDFGTFRGSKSTLLSFLLERKEILLLQAPKVKKVQCKGNAPVYIASGYILWHSTWAVSVHLDGSADAKEEINSKFIHATQCVTNWQTTPCSDKNEHPLSCKRSYHS